MEQVQILRVVVASPGDVQSEREVLPKVIEELNHSTAGDRGLRLELTRWETDTHPGFHNLGPQGLIEPILKITDCDLLIGIFWKRFGTPTRDGKTGTEHEFLTAYRSWKKKRSPQIFVYFNQKAYSPKSKAETDQWGQVLDFQGNYPKEGLWWPYNGKADFEKIVRNHLINYIRNLPEPDGLILEQPLPGLSVEILQPGGELRNLLVQFRDPELRNNEEFDSAVMAVVSAIVEEKIYLRRLSRGASQDISAEEELSRLWLESGKRLRKFRKALAHLCVVKGYCWTDERLRVDAKYSDLLVDVDLVFDEMRELLEKEEL